MTPDDTAALIRLHQAIEAHNAVHPDAPARFSLSGPVQHWLGEWHRAYVVAIIVDPREVAEGVGETIADAVDAALTEWRHASTAA